MEAQPFVLHSSDVFHRLCPSFEKPSDGIQRFVRPLIISASPLLPARQVIGSMDIYRAPSMVPTNHHHHHQ
jgi:hypothetical protein